MRETVSQLRRQLSQSLIVEVLQWLQQIFTLSESDLLNDAILVSAQYHKLRSERRKGILAPQQDELRSNRINHAIASLIDEIAAHPQEFRGEEKIQQQLESSLAQRGEETHLPPGIEGPLLARIVRFKKKGHSPRLLWLDDGPGDDPYEGQILTALGVRIEVRHRSAEAEALLQREAFDLLVSDIKREGNPREGLEMFDRLREAQLAPRTIFYITRLDRSRGVPAYAFGITNQPHELIHLVLDVLERSYA